MAAELTSGGQDFCTVCSKGLRANPTHGYPGRREYGDNRVYRLSMYVRDVYATDSSEEWLVHERGARHVQREFQRLHEWTYDVAIKTRDFMREVLRMPPRSRRELTSYACMHGQRSEDQDTYGDMTKQRSHPS